MDLNLNDKLTEEEQNEIKRRAFSMMEQLFFEGVSTGRELVRENLHFETEKYITDKILFLSNYFLDDKVWSEQPPANYREQKEVPKYEPENAEFGCPIDKIDESRNLNIDDTPETSEEKPEWAKEEKPFK